MYLTLAERGRLREMLLSSFRDWKGVHAALSSRRLQLSQSSLDRFFAGRTRSPRTLRTLALLLNTTPEALVNQVQLVDSSSRWTRALNLSKISRLEDEEAFRVAYQLWVEMTTRKLGLPIDPSQDLVTECYDSWYAFFKVARELIKAIPLHRNPQSAELRQLIVLSQAVLNEGLRPHLQRWQARFRRWSSHLGEKTVATGRTPQDVQQTFPEWIPLRDDLFATNRRLITYVNALETMVGKPRSR
jgi:hypothetical protein